MIELDWLNLRIRKFNGNFTIKHDVEFFASVTYMNKN